MSAFFLLLAFAGVGSVLAEEGPRGPRGGGGLAANRDEVFKMVDAYIAMNLEQALGLSPEQFTRVLPLVKKLQTDRRHFTEQRHEKTSEIRRRLHSGGATESQVATLVRDLRALETEEPIVLGRDRNAIDAALSVVQQAKFRVLEVEIDVKIRTLARRNRGGMRERPPR
jgi:hypothetical protein